MFSYLWPEPKHRLDSTKLHNLTKTICRNFNATRISCNKCGNDIKNIPNLTALNVEDYKNGHILKGDLYTVVWVVIKLIIPNYMSTMLEIKDIAYGNNKQTSIGKEKNRQMKFIINDLPAKKWNNSVCFVTFTILTTNDMSSDSYTLARHNLLKTMGLLHMIS